MIFIFGGRCQGKLCYAKKTFGEELLVSDLKTEDIESALSAGIIINVQDGVKKLLKSGKDPVEYFRKIMPELEQKILIGNEIGCGIVPADAFEREWRDETGFVYQLLSQQAKKVIRVFAGLPQILKE